MDSLRYSYSGVGWLTDFLTLASRIGVANSLSWLNGYVDNCYTLVNSILILQYLDSFLNNLVMTIVLDMGSVLGSYGS